jgi:hypothetical protein
MVVSLPELDDVFNTEGLRRRYSRFRPDDVPAALAPRIWNGFVDLPVF